MIKSRRLRGVGHVAKMEEINSAFKILTDKPTGKRPLVRPRRRWEHNIRTDLKDKSVNTIKKMVDSVQHRDYLRVLVNVALNLQIP